MSETRMTKERCSGCYNDEYNHGLGGAKQCWNFKSAKLIKRKRVHVDQRPPWKQAARLYPSCYSEQRYAFINGDREE